MSGFEIVGIVLGGLPLLYEGVKAAQFYSEGLGRWWEFRTDFESFVRAIEFEEVIFGQNLDMLLGALVLSDGEHRTLRRPNTSNLWHHPDIVSKLQLHLGEALPYFIKMLTELDRDINELRAILPIQNGEACFPASRGIDYERLKLSISFSRKRHVLVDKIHTTNERLGQILRNAKAIEMERVFPAHRRVSSSEAHAGSFMQLQKQSRTLYAALKSKFSCSCSSQHRCGISATWDKSNLDTGGPSLKLLIDDREGRKQVRWELEAADRVEPPVPTDQQHNLGQIYELDLQSNLLKAKDDSLKAAKDYNPAALAFSSFELVSDLSNTTVENKGAGWAKNLTAPVKRLNSAIRGTSSTLLGQTKIVQPTQKRPRIIGPAPRPAPTTAKHNITNICSFIKSSPTTDKYLGMIEADYHDIKLYLEPQFQGHLLKAQHETMEAVWSSTIDLSARLRVGLSVAVTLLTLGTSSWIPRCWGRNDVFLMRCNQGSTFGPYLDHTSLSFTLKEEPMNAGDHAVLAMFSLGVLLLELHYRTPLESSPYWDKHCPGGLRNEYTDMAAAREWYEDLASDPALEEGLAEPVRRCIEASFSTYADMEDRAFLIDVLETVVEPLEEFIDQWDGI
ncbi:hypothetical protein CEP54_012056 [Fusarium duplospermum]|uniref:DUF7580 domain-containing protein n=1 Tax=Fusarium duplospermum TaxID=1325734 RepID=A0A428PAW1_9HYPO|nr:hypothetical protein CEP54_012056 [Fusarium duplospermum]